MKFLKMHIIKSTELNYTQKNAELPTKVGIYLNALRTMLSICVYSVLGLSLEEKTALLIAPKQNFLPI
ncbi:MAG: hypothetical protein A3F46_06865 [Legionellales bacterium RIFCSPHIGHO2_12_FULL_42_9]|nr:MAG: hypothetical protein A3F46_06865 [Legionellales bacterium RIFCSPHIGHO2_12_FULL_42_9]